MPCVCVCMNVLHFKLLWIYFIRCRNVTCISIISRSAGSLNVNHKQNKREFTNDDLGVQQYFGVVYHELTNAKTGLFCKGSFSLAARAK